jgi:hypothetical protein
MGWNRSAPMLDQFFSQNALLFSVPALVGTLAFVVKIGLMTLGGIGADVDLDVDADVDVDLGADVEAGDSTEAFKLLSLQSIAAFLMGFGWGGLAGLFGLEWSLPASLGLGIGFGLVLMWLLGLMLKGMYDLQSSGNIDADDTVGLEATVYANVPASGAGRGQVRVIVKERARIYTAVSVGPEIKTSSRVRVTRVHDDNTLVVTPV